MALAASARVQGAGPAQAAAPGRLAGLGNRFVELLGRNLSRPDFAAEMAGLIADAIRTKAVAVLGYERRRDRLILLADHDLPGDARAALGDGGACQWEIPLRGLRNRRINVIEAAHQNPFVARALANLSPTALSIASLPIYYDHEPTGVLLLFAVGSRAFPDAHLQTLSQALRVCARGLREPDGGASRGAEWEPEDDSAGAAAVTTSESPASAAPQLHLVESSPPTAPQDEDLLARIQDLDQRLVHAHEEVERHAQTVRALTASGNALARERDALRQELTELEGGRAIDGVGLRSEIAALQDRLLAVDSERARYQHLAEARHTAAQKAIATLESERDSLFERSQSAETSVAELQTALSAVRTERDRLTVQVESLTTQMHAGEETLHRLQERYAVDRATVETDRDGWKEQTAIVRAQLAQRTESSMALEGELRSAVVARDAALNQLQAARAEIGRLAPLAEELSGAATQLEAARAGARAENESLRRTLEDERAARARAEHGLQTDLAAARAEGEGLGAELAAVRRELTERARAVSERDTHIAALRAQHEATQQAHASGQQANAALRAEAATLMARVEQNAAERQQFLDERDRLRASLAEMRQRANDADIAHAAAFGQLQAEAAELRRQVEILTADRAGLTERLQRAVEDGRAATRRSVDAQHRAEELGGLLRQRDAGLTAVATEREQLGVQVTSLTGQLQAAQEALERAQARYAEGRAGLAAERDEWREQLAAAHAALADRTERVAGLERDLQSTVVARDAAANELQAMRDERDQLSMLNEQLDHAVGELEITHHTVVGERTALRRALWDERASRADTERGLRTELAAARTEMERLTATAVALQNEVAERARAVAEREAQLAAQRSEIENLRQQSADRGVLAHHASELGRKVVELEQSLAAARGEAAGAERQRAALAEQLEAAQRRETESATAAACEQVSLRDGLERLTEERDRLQADVSARTDDLEARHAALTELQATLDRVRAEGAMVRDQREEAARRVEELDAVVRERDTALSSTTSELERLASQLAAVQHEARTTAAALESARERHVQDQRALEGDRDVSKQQLAAARVEVDRLSALTDELRHAAAQLDAARAAAVAESAQAQRAVEDAGAAGRHREATLQRDMATLRGELEHLSADAATLRSALVEREGQLAVLRRNEETARQTQSEWQEAGAALRSELGKVAAQLQERDAECQQLREGQAELERQLALVAATHGEEEQALAQGLQAARAQVANLERERSAVRTALSKARQQARLAESDHAAALAAAQSELTTLRQQAEILTGDHSELAERLERAEETRAVHERRAEEERGRVAAIAQQCAQLQQSFDGAEAGRVALDGELTRLRAELAAVTARMQERADECEHLRDERASVERRLAAVLATQGKETQTLAEGLQAAHQQVAQLEQERVALQATLAETREHARHAEAAGAAMMAQAETGAAVFRQQVEALTAERAALAERLEQTQQALAEQVERTETESRQAAARGEQYTQLEQALATTKARRAALERELTRAATEIENLRQQSADRGVLAHQASDLGSKVVDLEQRLAVVRGDADRAERERAALAEELEAARRQHAEATTVAECEQATLHETLQRLRDEHSRLETEKAAQYGQIETQRAALAELEATLMQFRTERARAEEDAQDAAQRLAGAHRRLEELSTTLQQRDATVGSAAAEQKRRAAQVTKLTSELRTRQEELDTLQGRSALERAAIEAERQTWKQQLDAAQAELERQAALTESLNRAATELEAARSAIRAENGTLRRALEDERLGRQETEQGLRGELTQVRAELDGLSGDAASLLGKLAERDEQLVALRQEQVAVRQAEADGQLANAGLRAEVARLAEQLEEDAAERRQLSDGRADTERQLKQVLATAQHEGEQTRQELEAARQHMANVECERGVLQETLAQARQALNDAEAIRAETNQRQRAAVAEMQQQVAALTAERATLQDRLQRAERATADEIERFHRETERNEMLAARCSQIEQALAVAEATKAELAQLPASLEQIREERDRVMEAERAAARRLAEAEQRLQDSNRQIRQSDALLQAAAAERDQFAKAARAAEAATADVVNDRAELQRRVQEVLHQLDRERISHAEDMALLARKFASRVDRQPEARREADAERTPQDSGPLVIERAAPLGVVVESAAEPPEPPMAAAPEPFHAPAAAEELVLLDEGPLCDDACTALASAGFEVSALPPTEGGVDEVARRNVKCAMLNLGSGIGAWRTLRALRERTSTQSVPILTYAMTAKVPKGFSFGRADFALWPTEPDRIVERLVRLRPKLRRLLALSADVDGMSRLREPLAAAGISTSIVLDGKQALEFAAMIEPEAVVLHLSPACPSVARAIIGLRTGQLRDLPLLFVLDKAPAAREEAFFTSVILELLGKAGFQFANLPEEIARVIA